LNNVHTKLNGELVELGGLAVAFIGIALLIFSAVSKGARASQ
jgi:hypothetical protein